MKITEKILTGIALQVLRGYNQHLQDTIGSLEDHKLMKLHYLFVKVLQGRKEGARLYEAITSYVKGLSRIHRGFFWKILNFYEWNLSCRWYKSSRENVDLIMYSLCPHSPKGMLSIDSDEYKIRVKALESVMYLTVKLDIYGLKRNTSSHIKIPPTPKQ
jgi:hypothetical protein